LEGPNAGGIGLIHIDGLEPVALAQWLWDRHHIVVTPIVHPEFDGLRITPNVYTSTDEVDLLGDKLLEAIKRGV